MQRRRDVSMCEHLPEELLDLILNKLDLLSDFIKFGVVCKTWYNVFLQRKQHRIERCKNEVPLLLCATKNNEYKDHIFRSTDNIIPSLNLIYNIIDKSSYDSMSPVVQDISLLRTGKKWRYVCSYGYFATANIKEWGNVIMNLNNTTFKEGGTITFNLKNPITGHTISLPPLYERFPDRINMVVLSCDPCIYPDKCVVAYLNSTSTIVCIRLGSNKWSKFQVESRKMIDAIIFHKGQLYAVNTAWDLFAIGCFWESNNGDNGDFQTCDIVGTGACYAEGLCMVESLRGELLMIVRTQKFEVYKRVTTNDENKKGHWVQIRRLDEGEVLFCSGLYRTRINVICSRCRNLKADSIYYFRGTGQCEMYAYEMHVYSLNEERVTEKHVLDVKLENCWVPNWINPSLQ